MGSERLGVLAHAAGVTQSCAYRELDHDHGFSWLVALRVVVPSIRVLRRNAVCDFSAIFRACQHDEILDHLATAIEAVPASSEMRNRALDELTYMLAVQAIPASDITPAGIIHFGLAFRAVSAAKDKHARRLAGVCSGRC